MISKTFALSQTPPTHNNVKIKLNLTYYFFIFVLSLFISATAFAVVIPTKIPLATNDPLFAKGYLNVMHYGIIAGNNSGAIPADNVALINQAIKHAYNRENDTEFEDTGLQSPLQGSLSLYFPSGVYWVNNTIKAHTATGLKKQTASDPDINFDAPRNHLTIVGAITKSATGNYNIYPVIKLVGNNRAPSFNDSTQPKHLVEFLNWFVTDDGPIATCVVENGERGNEGYNQMVKGLELDCNGNAGCVGLFFNQAQNSSIENVRIKPGHTGIKGSVGPGVMANIEIINGLNGIDTLSFSDTADNKVLAAGCTGKVVVRDQSGAVFTNLKLNGQTNRSIYHRGPYPLIIAGFEITTPPSSAGLAAVKTFRANEYKAASGIIGLIDGVINLGSEPSVAAIDNTAGKNIYVRNVYVTSGNLTDGKLIKSMNNATITANGSTKRIAEYNYTRANTDSDNFQPFNLINCQSSSCPDKNEYATVVSNASPHPSNLASRHAWLKKPFVDESGVFDVRTAGIDPGVEFSPIVVDHNVLQGILNKNSKVFLPKGIYQLTGPITLRANNTLFGAGRGLTRIETAPNFPILKNPSGQNIETPIISTADSAEATTYLGELSIGVNTAPLNRDYFIALNWKAGANSMVHIGQVYHFNLSNTTTTTNSHSLLKITGNGGGRWYAAGAIKTLNSKNPDFHILKVEGTTQPLWLYSLNPEHPSESDTYVKLTGAHNVRIYGIKSEYAGAFEGPNPPPVSYLTSVLSVANSDNIGIFGHSALRNGLNNKGAIEISNSTKIVTSLIAPYKNNLTEEGPKNPSTLKEIVSSGGPYDVDYPHVVTLFKRGELSDNVMVHTAPLY